MGITKDEALKRLAKIDPSSEEALDKLKALINEVDATGEKGKTTVFFSGLPKGTSSTFDSTKYRLIGDTEAGKFLKSTAFEEKLRLIIPDAQRRNDFINDDIKDGGAWDTVSRNFAKATEGDAVVLAGENIQTSRKAA